MLLLPLLLLFFLSLHPSLSANSTLRTPRLPRGCETPLPSFPSPSRFFFRETQATILSHLPVPFPVCRSSNSNNHQPPGHTVCRHPTLAFVVISTSNYHTLLKVFILLLQSTLILYITFFFLQSFFQTRRNPVSSALFVPVSRKASALGYQ